MRIVDLFIHLFEISDKHLRVIKEFVLFFAVSCNPLKEGINGLMNHSLLSTLP